MGLFGCIWYYLSEMTSLSHFSLIRKSFYREQRDIFHLGSVMPFNNLMELNCKNIETKESSGAELKDDVLNAKLPMVT